MQEREEIRQLFERYRLGQCTPEEQARLHSWFNQYAGSKANGLTDLYAPTHIDSKRRGLRWLLYAAAVVFLAFVSVWYLATDSVENEKPEITLASNDIAPGGNRATLTLVDGRSIDLSEAESGIVVGYEGIVYERAAEELVDLEANYAIPLVLSTPKGGTYQVTLSDGTKVWLNAASTLKYPSRFTSAERVVEMEGEAYFLVSKNPKRPFKVLSGGQQIEVLGTEFNISAYTDEGEVKTTLVEGSVVLQANMDGQRISLVPNEQSILRDGIIRKQQVDVGPFIAWKDGNFHFDNTTLADMMKQMSRWYDVNVTYENEVPNERFSGAMSRNVTLRTVLELLRISGINYRIQDKDLIIE